jgi:hypothetical protein
MLVEVKTRDIIMAANEKRRDEQRLQAWVKALKVVRETLVSINTLSPIRELEKRKEYHALVVEELKIFLNYGLLYASIGNVVISAKWAKNKDIVKQTGAASNAIRDALSSTTALQKRLEVIKVLKYINRIIHIIDDLNLQLRVNNLRSTQLQCVHCGLYQKLYHQHRHTPLLLDTEVLLVRS